MENVDDILDAVEKKFKVSTAATESEFRGISTGTLVTDLMLSGGIRPGALYTMVGAEQSAKSTQSSTILASAIKTNIPVLALWDYEGSFDPNYFEKIAGDNVDVSTLFGVKDKNGKWTVKPRVRYYAEAVGELFFNTVASMLRNLPDREKVGDKWYEVWPATKLGRKMANDKHVKKYYSKFGKLYVPLPDDANPIQVLILLDSYPAMLPAAQDDDDGNNSMALQARMFADNIKKILGKLRNKACTIIGVNQLRLRPAVMYGPSEYEPCFIGSTRILLENGEYDTIRNIVVNKRNVNVVSLNVETGETELKPVTAWKENGFKKLSDLVRVTYRSHDQRYSATDSFVCTKNHKILTQFGYTEAQYLNVSHALSLSSEGDVYRAQVKSVEMPKLLSKADTAIYDLTVKDNHNYFVGNRNKNDFVCVSNCGEAMKFGSSVRIKHTPRAIPHGKGQLEEETSVDGGTDVYRYIHMRAIKNKMSTPFLDGWQRLWITDSKGKPHGFDIVWDSFQYLKTTGQITGNMKKLTITMEGTDIDKKLTWLDFKKLILLKGKDLKEICKKLGIKKNPKIREKCFKQLQKGNGLELYFDNLRGKKEEDEDES